VGELDPQLVAAAGLRSHFQPGKALGTSAALVAQQGPAGVGRVRLDDMYPAGVILSEPIQQAGSRLGRLPFDDGPVDLLDRALTELLGQSGRGLAGAGEQE